MKGSPEDLLKILRAGDANRVAEFFENATEEARQPFAKPVMAWCDLLELNWRANFNKRAEQKLAASEKIKKYDQLMPAAHTAALACASLAQIKSIGFFGLAPIEALVAVLQRRKPSWLDEYGEFLCETEMQRGWARYWKRARALVQAGLCRPPRHPNYVLGVLEGIWPPFQQDFSVIGLLSKKKSLPEPTLVELLLAERDWLDTDFWRLFELDGTGEISLANCEKYGKSEQTWTEALVELARQGVLSRDRLLDASLSALTRDFIQFRAGWFSRFHDALRPETKERVARSEKYLALLGSSNPPTVAFALDAVAMVDRANPFPAAKLLPSLSLVMNARGKAVLKTALQLLDRVATSEPAARPQACVIALAGLLNDTAEIQKEVFTFLERHADKHDKNLRAKLVEVGDAVLPSLRNHLKHWKDEAVEANRGNVVVVKKKKQDAEVAATPTKIVDRIDPARAIVPIANLDDLLHFAGIVLEKPEQPHEIERVIDAISRLCDQRPDDFIRRAAPLRKRALKKRNDKEGSRMRYSELERALAMVLLSWIDAQNAFTEKPEDLAHGQNQFAFLFRRLRVLSIRAATGQALPLLSVPTHLGGWIEPATLVERWLIWQTKRVIPDPHDQILALLRLAPEGRERALNAAKSLAGEAGQALRFALGETVKTGRDAALWLAAWRCRQPHGDLPEFEKIHPNLGPDAGHAAKYTWRVWSERHNVQNHEWTTLELELKFEPKCPKRLDDTLLPVLFHGEWNANEEDCTPLLRWADQFWPGNREAFYARAARRLEISVDYADALDRDFIAYLEPLADPHTELRPMACLALAFGLASQDASLRSCAQEGLMSAISDGRLNALELGAVMSRVLDTGVNKLARWAKSLTEVARISPAHAIATADLLQRAMRGDPAKAPRDLGALLDLLVELLSETGEKLEDRETRNYLASLTSGGKVAKLAKQLLSM